jgi:hypothetical protein
MCTNLYTYATYIDRTLTTWNVQKNSIDMQHNSSDDDDMLNY